MKIIGLAGTFASGKDTAAEFLARHFKLLHISTSDMVREESLKIHGSDDRKYLITVANDMREKHGGDYFLRRAFEEYKKTKDDYPEGVIISGIRSLGEVNTLKASGGKLVFVDAPVEIRYKRARMRMRDDEVASLDDFISSEKKELNRTPNNTEQNIMLVKEQADIVVENSSDLAAFEEKLQILF